PTGKKPGGAARPGELGRPGWRGGGWEAGGEFRGGRHAAAPARVGRSPRACHARLHVLVRTDPGRRHRPDFDAIERRMGEAALTWSDRLRQVLIERRGEAGGLALAARYRHAFPIGYQEDVTPAEALDDLRVLEALREQPRTLQLSLHRPAGQKPQRVPLRIVRLAEPVPISDVLPMLENFGLRVISERPYELAWPEGGAAWIQDFELEHRDRLI